MMKKLILSLAVMAASLSSMAQNWSMDKAHSKLSFTITHMMLSEVDGQFKGFDAKITSAKPDFSDAVIEMTAPISGVDTDNDMRDGHIKGPDFFDAAKFETMTFKSTSVKKVKGTSYVVKGNLTLHGVTKPIVLAGTLNGPVEDPRSKKSKIGLKLTGAIDRVAFGVGGKSPALSDEVQIKAAGEFTKD